MEERLQKLISAVGLCSRRAAEGLIAEGKVTINGRTAQIGERADPKQDDIRIEGNPLPGAPEPIYLMLNKPRGYVTTLSDEQGRPTIADLVGDAGGRVYPVGRLDMDSEGLLLLTNDGAFMQHLLHPSHEVEKTYHVSVSGTISGADKRLASITDLDGESIRPAQVEFLSQGRDTALLSITIHEGKNRQIRRMCEHCGLFVKRLRRVREHCVELGELPLSHWRYLTREEIEALLHA